MHPVLVYKYLMVVFLLHHHLVMHLFNLVLHPRRKDVVHVDAAGNVLLMVVVVLLDDGVLFVDGVLVDGVLVVVVLVVVVHEPRPEVVLVHRRGKQVGQVHLVRSLKLLLLKAVHLRW